MAFIPILLSLLFGNSNVITSSTNSLVVGPPIPTNWVIYIVASGIIYTIVAAVVQRKLSNPKRTRELQDQIKINSKEINEMIKNNAPKEEINKKQAEMMPLMKESMTVNMKATFVLIPSFLVVYYLLMPFAFGWLGNDSFVFTISSYNVSLHYKGLFFITVFVLGLVTSMSILLYDKRRAKLDTKSKLEAEGIKV